jgi:hypothetical protein
MNGSKWLLIAVWSFVVAGLLSVCTGCGARNLYLARYKVQTAEQEHALLAQEWPTEADEILLAKQKLRTDPRNFEAMLALSRAYTAIAEREGVPGAFRDYCLEAGGYELKLYRARGGGFPPALIAETGRNLHLREDSCRGHRWLKKAIALEAGLDAEYGAVAKEARVVCEKR